MTALFNEIPPPSFADIFFFVQGSQNQTTMVIHTKEAISFACHVVVQRKRLIISIRRNEMGVSNYVLQVSMTEQDWLGYTNSVSFTPYHLSASEFTFTVCKHVQLFKNVKFI